MPDSSAADASMTIIFRGVRGSHPMPGPATARYGGNTASQEIRVGGRLLVFDAGTGIISLGRELAKRGRAGAIALFFSHNHHDHIDGLLYFRPAYMTSTTMHIFGPADDRGDIEYALELLSRPAVHPIPLSSMGMNYDVTVLSGGERVVWRPDEPAPRPAKPEEELTGRDVVVRILKNRLHPVDGVLNFRLEYAGKSYVYASDVEGDEEKGDPVLADFARDADVLAHDGQYMSDEYFAGKVRWGHSTVNMAVKTARMANAKRLVILHHDPEHSDEQLDRMAAEAATLFPGIIFAKEGESIIL